MTFNSALRRSLLAAATTLALAAGAFAAERTLLNVSYDPTREFYDEYNQAFNKHWQAKTGDTVTVQQSHGGSGKQARAVIDGLDADVVTLALAYDIDAIASKSAKLPADWQSKLDLNSSPYTSTIVFLVRKGNPKNIKDWNDLVRDDVKVITPNPKTSGGARWNYLAAWGYALQQELGDLAALKDPAKAKEVAAAQEKAKAFVAKLLKNVPVLDSGARGATNTFVQRGIGDVLLAWENEALLSTVKLKEGDLEIVVPSLSILAEPPVAVVTENAKRKGNEELATAYLQYLYSAEGQQLAAKHFYRPQLTQLVDAALLKQFPKAELFKLNDVFGSWKEAQATHFDDGGSFDQIYLK